MSATNFIAKFLGSLVAATSLLFFHEPSRAASFDCKKASAKVETLVCSDKVLSSFDSRLDAAYRSALKYPQQHGDRVTLFQTQKEWLKTTRDACQDTECLREAYNQRISVVNRAVAKNPEACVAVKDFSDCIAVSIYRDANAKNHELTESLVLLDQPGKIENCQTLVEIRHSFGGYCILRNGNTKKHIKICHESMTGNSFFKPIGKSKATKKSLVEYIKYNCFGG